MSIRKYSRVASRRLRPVMADHENHSGGDTQQERQIRMDTIHKWTWHDSQWTINSLTLGKQRMQSLLALDLINGLEMVSAANGWTVGGCLPMRDRSISFPQAAAAPFMSSKQYQVNAKGIGLSPPYSARVHCCKDSAYCGERLARPSVKPGVTY
ncbi:hypothetical protein AOLI_G00306670 [Acnodon oligacanthus]